MRLTAKDFFDFIGGKASEEIKAGIATELAKMQQGELVKKAITKAAEEYLTSSFGNRHHPLKTLLIEQAFEAVRKMPDEDKHRVVREVFSTTYNGMFEHRVNLAIDAYVGKYLLDHPEMIKELVQKKLGL